MSTLLRITSLLLAFSAATAFADRQDFVRDTRVTTAQGVTTQHVEQDVTATGYTREVTRTNPKGQTATRDIEVVRDPVTGTKSRTVSGTTYSGKTYSRENISEKTPDGYTRSHTHTTPNGKTHSHTVDVSRSGNTTTRDAVRINNKGRVVHKTTVKTRAVR